MRVYLRALEFEDYKMSIDWRRDDEVWSMLVGPKYFVSSEYEKKWVENVATKSEGNSIQLAVCLKENDKYIGNIYLTGIDWINRTAESHTIIGDKNEWGKGYATEAKRLMLDFAFGERNLRKIHAKILEDNKQSIRVCEKCGYKQEGVLKEAVFKNGKYIDVILFAVFKKDYMESLTAK